MTVSRRGFIVGTSALAAGAVAAPLLEQAGAAQAQAAVPQQAAATPPIEIIALNKMGYGPRPDDVARVRSLGLAGYVAEQLNPSAIDDSACDAKLAAARVKLYYTDKAGAVVKNSAAPLALLNMPMDELWARYRSLEGMMDGAPWQEYMRPWEEVRVATWVRALYSKRQLQELLVEFWHNHFNVNASSGGEISAVFPAYDRIMRENCLGNFRAFTEAVGRSTAMMYYLDNRSNKAGGGEAGNENYARELFELHTLGSDNYLKFYDDRSKIGTVTYGDETFARGYIDDDVYDAAECFTGWTLADGHWELPDTLPNNGQFYYYSKWHYTGDKTVLSPNGFPNIAARQEPEKDGKDVYDLVCYHPGTARHLCLKLCRRLLADNPPSSVVDKAVATWMQHRRSPDQIKRVVETILLSDEFKGSWGQKVKRPFELVVSYMRATNCGMPTDLEVADGKPAAGGYWGNILGNYNQAGHRLFEWPTPTGHPDLATYWLSTNGMLRRWNILDYLGVSHPQWGANTGLDLLAETRALGVDITKSSCTQIADAWIGRLFGYGISATTRQAAIDFLALKSMGGDPSKPPAAVQGEWAGDTNLVPDRVRGMIYLLAMSPEFQVR
jgi:uncharacterized protein (DUF1800 family)